MNDETTNAPPSLLDEAGIYLLAKSAVENSADPSDALVILLSGPLSQLHGRLFAPAHLSKIVTDYYGWRISSDAIEFLVTKLVRRGWLESRGENASRGPFYVNLPDPLTKQDEDNTVAELQKLGESFVQFAGDLSPINALPTDAIEAAALLLRYTVQANARGDGSHSNNETDYLCGRFIEDAGSRSREIQSSLSSLSSLGFLSIVVEDLGNPRRSRKVDLRVIVDGPVLLDFVGTAGATRAQASRALFDDLRSMGAQIVTFDHCLSEAQRVLRAVLKTLPNERRGPTGEAIRQGVVREDALRGLLSNFDITVRQLGISVLPDRPDYMPNSHHFFDDGRSRDLEAIVNWHEFDNDSARLADLDTTVFTLRRRGGHRTSDVFDSKFVCVSDNLMFAGATRRHLIETTFYNSSSIPPIISVKELSARVWLEIGDNNRKRNKLAYSHLLRSCERSVAINRAVIDRAREELQRTNPDKLERFEMVLNVPRSARAIADRSLNAEKYVTGDTIEGIVEAAIEAAAAEVSKSEKAKRKKLTEEHAAALQERQFAMENEVLRREHVEKTYAALESRRSQIDDEVIGAMCSRAGKRAAKQIFYLRIFGFLAILLPVAAGIALLISGQLAAWQIFPAIMIFLIAVPTAMNYPGKWLSTKLHDINQGWIPEELRRSGRPDLAESISVAWDDSEQAYVARILKHDGAPSANTN